MVTNARIEYRPNPLRQGSRNRRGTQVDREFVRYLLDLAGDTRALWLPGKSGTTLTDRSLNARVLTWSEEVSGFDTPPAELGSGYEVLFNGADEEGDVPDSDDFSFGDSAADQPFSVFALVRTGADPTNRVIVGKWDLTTSSEDREWVLGADASDRPYLSLYDESANAQVGRYDATALSASARYLLVATYDGTGASAGIRIYLNGARVDDTDSNSGTYEAMENGATKVLVAHRIGASANEHFWDGRIALWGVVGKAMSQDEVWALKEASNGYFGLSL